MKDQSIITALVAYGAAIVVLCWFCRPRGGYRDFIVGNKSSGWLITAFGLFTLIGGGELVAGATFGYVFGWAGIALFIGYGISFVLLALLSPRVLSDATPGTVTYVDYAHQKYGNTVGGLVLLSHLFPFFALLVLQLSAGGHVISQLSSVSYLGSVLSCAFLVCVYLFLGGFRAVMVTDLVQGFVMAFLIVVIVYAAYGFIPAPHESSSAGFERPSVDTFWGVLISGVVIGLASADVWQRVFAARSSNAARNGFIIGGVLLAVYGGLIVYLGILSKTAKLTADPESAFLSVLQSTLPAPLFAVAIFGTLAAILSTADTEVFLVSSLLDRGRRQWIDKRAPWTEGAGGNDRQFGKGFIVAIVALACIGAYWGSNLALLFNWLFVSYMVFAPTIAASLLFPFSRNMILLSFALTAATFVSLLLVDVLTLENSYILTLPAVVVYTSHRIFSRNSGRV